MEEVETKPEVVIESKPEPITMKDPKKVEQGKKLAAISKAAKEKKMRAKIEEEMAEKKIHIPIPLLFGVPIVGGYLMYRYFFAGKSATIVVQEPVKKEKSPVKSPPPSPPKKKKKSLTPPPSPPKKKFESFD